MSSRNWLANILMACVVTVGSGGAGHIANAASAGQPLAEPRTGAGNIVIAIKNRGRPPWPVLPIAPSYLAYDYPYYYNRGHYPTHVGGPGYVYYAYPYSYRRSARNGGRCSYGPAKSLHRAWIDARRCVGN
jgi:hypothetical protein